MFRRSASRERKRTSATGLQQSGLVRSARSPPGCRDRGRLRLDEPIGDIAGCNENDVLAIEQQVEHLLEIEDAVGNPNQMGMQGDRQHPRLLAQLPIEDLDRIDETPLDLWGGMALDRIDDAVIDLDRIGQGEKRAVLGAEPTGQIVE